MDACRWTKAGTLVVMAALAGAPGCGGTGTGSGASVTWKANGVPGAAVPFHIDWNSDGVQDTFTIYASASTTALTIAIAAPSPLSPGTFLCGQTPPQAAISYAHGTQSALDAQTCTVAITQVGKTPAVPITGTFDATFMQSGGGTTTLTDGAFRLPLRF